MAQDEDAPPRRQRLDPPVLDPLGITELHGYIEELKMEIMRVEAEISRKISHRSAAAAFFKQP